MIRDNTSFSNPYPSPLLKRRQVLAAAGSAALCAMPLRARAQDNAILIGRTYPLSGPAAPFMDLMMLGLNAAVADANAAGGIQGRPIKIIDMDDGFDAKRAAANMETLIDKDNVIALMQVTGTPSVLAAAALAEAKRVPLIGVNSAYPGLYTMKNPYLFTTRASQADELNKIFQTMTTVFHQPTAIVHEESEYNKILVPLVPKLAADAKVEILATKGVAMDGSNAAAVIDQLIAIKPKSILMLGTTAPAMAVLAANRDKLGVPVYGLSYTVGTRALAQLGEKARGLASARNTPSPWSQSIPFMREFQASMARNKGEASYDSITGYTDGRVLVAALKIANSLTREGLREAMGRLGELPFGFPMKFTPTQQHGSRYVSIAIIDSRGKFLR